MTKENKPNESAFDTEKLLQHAERWLPVAEAGAKAFIAHQKASQLPSPPSPHPPASREEPVTGWRADVATLLSGAAILCMVLTFFAMPSWHSSPSPRFVPTAVATGTVQETPTKVSTTEVRAPDESVSRAETREVVASGGSSPAVKSPDDNHVVASVALHGAWFLFSSLFE
ncbi:hypothetical protein [Burkholderia cenocepacia]|uniref:hypothetical protein n=1 Tax=Burkholderia cenocepacia TaxID=95486 RepID=UPI0012374A5F|nr:hypothetical protein [Burkholderia cenocepacia]